MLFYRKARPKRTGWRQCEKGEVHTRCATRPPDLPARALRAAASPRSPRSTPIKVPTDQTPSEVPPKPNDTNRIPHHRRGPVLAISQSPPFSFPHKKPYFRADLHAQTRIQAIQLPIGSNPHVLTPTLHCAILSKCRTPPICIGLPSIADLVPGPRKTPGISGEATIVDLLSHRWGTSGFDDFWFGSDNAVVLPRSEALRTAASFPPRAPSGPGSSITTGLMRLSLSCSRPHPVRTSRPSSTTSFSGRSVCPGQACRGTLRTPTRPSPTASSSTKRASKSPLHSTTTRI